MITEQDKIQTQKVIAHQVHQVQSFTGPIPPPEILAKYEDCFPGLAERIIVMAEKEQTRRHDIESKKLMQI